MLWNDFLQFMKFGNSNTTKFFGSEQNFDDIGTVIVSMANTQGGYVFLGFDLRNYHLIGSKFQQKDLEKLIKIHCNPYPVIKLDVLEKNQKEILIIRVFDSLAKPYYFNNKCFVMDEGKSKLSFLDQAAVYKSKNNESRQENPLTEAPVNSTNAIGLTQEDIEPVTVDLMTLNSDYQPDNGQLSSHSNSLPNLLSTDDLYISNNTVNFIPTNDLDSTLNERQQQTISFLKNHESIKNKKYRELHQVSHKTAHLELVGLVDKGKIESQGSGRSTCYVLKDKDQLSIF
jgi:predicted HTH transcriptional regulator